MERSRMDRYRNNKLNKISKTLTVCAIIFSIIFSILLITLNVLPFKYLSPILLLFCFINAIFIIFSFFKKTTAKIVKIILMVFTSLVILISFIGSVYLIKTIVFIGNFGDSNYKTENYSLVVLQDDSYDELSDINEKTIGILDDHSEDINKVKNHIDKRVKVDYKNYNTTPELFDALVNNDIEALVIEDSYKDMFIETNDSFEKLTKLIYSFSVTIDEEDITKSIDVTSRPFNIYISGIDTYGKISSVARSDVNIIVTVNPNTHKILLTSIPRDYYVKLNGVSGSDKLAHAGIYGIDMSVKTVEDLLGIDINYYLKVNFSSVIKIVDVLGGIDVNSEYTFTSYSGYHFIKGINHMNGEEALDFARTRKAFATGDRQRGKNQEAVIEALIKKCTSYNIIKKYSSLLDSLNGTFQTNLSDKEITSLAKYQLDEMPSWEITSISLDGTDDYNYTYSAPGYKTYVMTPTVKSIESAQQNLSEILEIEVNESSHTTNNNIDDDTKNENKSNISLNTHDITVNVGDKVTLKAILSNYDDEVKWSSSNEDIVIVDNGVITALKSGTITIKAEIEGQSDTCIVRVNDPLKDLLPGVIE